jgi:hypothetical protein
VGYFPILNVWIAEQKEPCHCPLPARRALDLAFDDEGLTFFSAGQGLVYPVKKILRILGSGADQKLACLGLFHSQPKSASHPVSKLPVQLSQ